MSAQTGAPVKHWHVIRHAEDDQIFTCDRLFDALAYAADELDRLAEHEHENIAAYGEAGEFERAYKSFVKSERYAGLAANARNAHHQGTAPLAERAPTYQDPSEVVNQQRAWTYARCVVHDISHYAGTFAAWECDGPAAECEHNHTPQ